MMGQHYDELKRKHHHLIALSSSASTPPFSGTSTFTTCIGENIGAFLPSPPLPKKVKYCKEQPVYSNSHHQLHKQSGLQTHITCAMQHHSDDNSTESITTMTTTTTTNKSKSVRFGNISIHHYSASRSHGVQNPILLNQFSDSSSTSTTSSIQKFTVDDYEEARQFVPRRNKYQLRRFSPEKLALISTMLSSLAPIQQKQLLLQLPQAALQQLSQEVLLQEERQLQHKQHGGTHNNPTLNNTTTSTTNVTCVDKNTTSYQASLNVFIDSLELETFA